METKHSVLQVNKLYYPHIGGIERIVQSISEGIRPSFEVQVLVCQPYGLARVDNVAGVSVTRAGSLGIWRSMPVSLSFPLIYRRMAPRFDLIHLHHPFPLGELSALKFNSRAKLVLTWYSSIVRQKYLFTLYRPLLEQLLERLDAIILIYPEALKHTTVLAQHHHKCWTIPLGIDAQQFQTGEGWSQEVAELREKYGDRLILFVGRLVYYKGLEYLITAMRSVSGRLLVVGDGPLKKALQKQVLEMGLRDRVVFVGTATQSRLRSLLNACDIFVLPSTHPSEAFGLVQLEAMACRKPVVNTNLPSGVPFVSLDRVTGLTVEPCNSRALAQAINTLLSDPELRRSYGENGRQRVLREFTAETMVKRTLELYHRLVEA